MTQRSDIDTQQRALAAARRRDEQLTALWEMTPDERVAAMWRRELSLVQLLAWSAQRPDEVPRIATDLTAPSDRGEFAWIVMTTPEWAEAAEAATPEAA
jgi:hypothetical protein